MDSNEMMIVCEIAQEDLRDKLLELYKRDKATKPKENDYCPNCNTYLKDEDGAFGYFCPNCGQKININ